MIYVTEMDVDDASFRQVVADLTEKYGKKIAPHFQPIRENENWSDISISLRMQEDVIPVWDSGKNVRFRITVNRTWRFSEIL